jgi:hypothetical protein
MSKQYTILIDIYYGYILVYKDKYIHNIDRSLNYVSRETYKRK